MKIIIISRCFVLEILLESNADLQKKLETTELPTYKYYTIKTTDQQYGKRMFVLNLGPCMQRSWKLQNYEIITNISDSL